MDWQKILSISFTKNLSLEIEVGIVITSYSIHYTKLYDGYLYIAYENCQSVFCE